ncbi:glycosyltransferase family 4 protein [Myxococcota bacterium]|nr:glycosyltransferase family 4 protein [Myxococcota bacterium]
MARGLSGAGEEVSVCTREADPVGLPGVDVQRLRLHGGWQPWRAWRFSAAAAELNRKTRPDCVQSFSRTRRQNIFRAGGGCHVRYMEQTYSARGAWLRRGSPRHAFALAMERAIFSDPLQLILCNSEMVRDEIGERFGVAEERLHVIYNGVDTDRFRPRRRGESVNRDQFERHWLLVGSGFRRKGVDRALSVMARRPKDERLTVVGSDPPAAWIARARTLGLSDRVFFRGTSENLPTLYRQADGLLLPTRYDAFANVCLEAAASGIPVVTSGANGAARWLGDGCRVVNDPEDIDGFAEALEVIRPAEMARSMGIAGRKRAESTTWADHIRALRALYRSFSGP